MRFVRQVAEYSDLSDFFAACDEAARDESAAAMLASSQARGVGVGGGDGSAADADAPVGILVEVRGNKCRAPRARTRVLGWWW